jgi:hypothetical protein
MDSNSTPAPSAAQAPTKETVFQHIKSVFESLGHIVSVSFQKIFGKTEATQFAYATLALLKTDVGKVAMAAVQEVEKMAAGIDKRKVAFDKIVADLKTEGLTVKNSVINMLIELAVQAISGTFV